MSGFVDDDFYDDVALDIHIPDDLDKKLQAKYRDAFIADVENRMKKLSQYLDHLRVDNDDVEKRNLLKSEIHNIKGEGASFGFPAISHVARGWEVYLYPLQTFTLPDIENLYFYADAIRDLITRDPQPDEIETAQILDALPQPSLA